MHIKAIFFCIFSSIFIFFKTPTTIIVNKILISLMFRGINSFILFIYSSESVLLCLPLVSHIDWNWLTACLLASLAYIWCFNRGMCVHFGFGFSYEFKHLNYIHWWWLCFCCYTRCFCCCCCCCCFCNFCWMLLPLLLSHCIAHLQQWNEKDWTNEWKNEWMNGIAAIKSFNTVGWFFGSFRVVPTFLLLSLHPFWFQLYCVLWCSLAMLCHHWVYLFVARILRLIA